VSGCPHDPEIFTIKPDGTGSRPITDNAVADLSPSWHEPVGSATELPIAITRFDGRDDEIYQILSNGDASQTNKVTNANGLDENPSYAERSCLLFDSNRGGNFDIYQVFGNAGESTVERLASNPARDSDPDWNSSTTTVLCPLG
jgi:Tol biopolymer transport system component